MEREARRPKIPTDAYQLHRCAGCGSPELKLSRTRAERDDEGNVLVVRRYVRCLKCGRRSWGIFD